ncbi:MAG TPA: DUF4214 domain-containing protein [Iamia sp.]
MRSRSTRLLVAVVTGAALLVGTVATAPSAGAASPANTAYVRSLYLDLLDRSDPTADQAGIDYWADRLEQPGMTRAGVVENIQRGSTEYYGTIVDLYYLLFLDRTAEPAGRAFYVERWRDRRLTLEAVAIALGQSPEYYARVGATTASFVDAIFFDTFGRSPSPADQTYYQSVVATRGRGRVVSILVKSQEKRTQTVNDQYGTFLGRAPTASERSTAVSQLGGGLRREDFDARLVASDEYYTANSTG